MKELFLGTLTVAVIAVPLATVLFVRAVRGRCRNRERKSDPRGPERRPGRWRADGRLAMLKVKHFMVAVEPDDGQRLWVEPIGLTRDLCEWCQVHGVLTRLGPPLELWMWFEAQGNPDAYPYFRGAYHDHLSNGRHRPTLQGLAWQARQTQITLLHQGDDPQHNTAAALYEFLSELQSYCPPQT
jgi:uncharacterized protein YeaO (DUF488 family)